MLVITDPAMVQDFFITKNKFIEKDPYFLSMFADLIPNTMAAVPSNQEWRDKRKVVSAAFYKQQLVRMIKMISIEVENFLEAWPKNGGSIDIMRELLDLTTRIILRVAFGEDVSDQKLALKVNG
jgi:cytochrome P450